MLGGPRPQRHTQGTGVPQSPPGPGSHGREAAGQRQDPVLCALPRICDFLPLYTEYSVNPNYQSDGNPMK